MITHQVKIAIAIFTLSLLVMSWVEFTPPVARPIIVRPEKSEDATAPGDQSLLNIDSTSSPTGNEQAAISPDFAERSVNVATTEPQRRRPNVPSELQKKIDGLPFAVRHAIELALYLPDRPVTPNR